MKKIADSGLLIAALDSGDTHHAWAKSLLAQEAPPWLVCEAVLTEVAASLGTPEPILEMLRVGDLELAFNLAENKTEVQVLAQKYRDQGMDLADACVVRMSELFESSKVYTVDRKDFTVYRRKGRMRIACEFPVEE